ncbi:alsin-like [Brachionichthys hirsutus]|uniref:alsin-like n=1 Tax=Brachionichthys hirsutus TaxID=412623 RepID=UPI0036047AC7
MESQRKSSGDEDAGERGLLHAWRGYSCGVTPERLLLPQPVLQVALGTRHGVLLVEGGHVYSVGDLPWKQSPAAASEPHTLESALSGQRVVAVAAGSFHSGAVTEDGAVHMWGDNAAGQCGLPGLLAVPNPTPVALSDSDASPPQTVAVLELACGGQHSLALSARGQVWAWGSGPQLGLAASVFPVWKPQKLEHLAGRRVLQVACGASHSLALVRCLGPQDVHRPPVDKCRQCNQLLYTMTDKEDHVIISDGHDCPLGVELTEEAGMAPLQEAETSPSETAPPSQTSSDPASDAAHHRDSGTEDTGPPPDSEEASARVASGVKGSRYPDEQAVRDYLRKLSGDAPAGRGTGPPPGGLHAPPSAGALASSALNSLVTSCASAVGERVVSTYEALSFKKMMNYLPSAAARSAAAPAGGDNAPAPERVRPEAKKSSSTGDIREEDAEGLRRRLSLPGLLPQVSPRLLRIAARPGTRAVALAPPGGAVPEAQEVFPTLQTEVWSWGRCEQGQLGHGDNLSRSQPLCIKSLNNKEVIRVAAGARHSLALTAQSQVFSWGSNSCGQLGHMESPSTVPRLAKLSDGIRVWDVGAGEKHTLLLADGDCIQPIIYYSGQRAGEGPEPGAAEEPPAGGGFTPQPVLLPFCMNLRYVSSVFAGGQQCMALSDRNVMGFIAGLHELAAAERKFYCRLCGIKTEVVRPLLELESLGPALGPALLGLLLALTGSFGRLCLLTGRHAASLTANLRRGRDVRRLLVLDNGGVFLDSHREYCVAVGDFLVMGGFQTLAKPPL